MAPELNDLRFRIAALEGKVDSLLRVCEYQQATIARLIHASDLHAQTIAVMGRMLDEQEAAKRKGVRFDS